MITASSSTIERRISSSKSSMGSEFSSTSESHQSSWVPEQPKRVTSYSQKSQSSGSLSVVLPSSSTSMSSSSSSMSAESSSSSSSSSSSGCQSSGYTYTCRIVYGPVRQTRICENVPNPVQVPCCSVCT